MLKSVIITAFSLLLHSFICAQVPVANFTSDIKGGCSPIVVNFKDASTGNPTSWSWDFGNGATSTRQNPSTSYFTPGTYTVVLTATNANGSNTTTKQAYITVYDPPSANLVANKNFGCTPYKIQFQDSSTAAANTKNTSWAWDFGDGTQSTLQNPLHVYRNPDNYTITLKVTNDQGCSKVVTKPNYINIIQGVTPNFNNGAPSACGAPATISFTNTSNGPGSISYAWDFGDGATSTDTNPSHTYKAKGKYSVTLVSTSSLGCTDTLRRDSVVVIGGYTTDFTVPPICEKTSVKLLNNSFPIPIRSLWRFPDGTTDSIRNPTKYFAASNSVAVTLINNYGNCTDSVTKTISVASKPVINFTSSDTVKCQPPLTANFTTGANATKYQWDFGDNSTSTSANPSHTYTKVGDYTVSLIASTAEGCTDTLKKPGYIKIHKPTITFSNLPASGCLPYTITPEAAITTLDSVVSYAWDFGDGTTSALSKPSHTYNKRGTYTVTLSITTSSGCVETYSLPAAVKAGPKPVANFTQDNTDVCASQTVKFTDLSTPKDSITQWLWKFSDGEISIQRDPVRQFNDTGWIDVTLYAINSGCYSAPLTKPRLIHVKPPVGRFEYRPNCDIRTQYTFTDQSIGAETWTWNFGDGSPVYNGQNPPVHNYPAGYRDYNVSLTVTNGSCNFIKTRTVSIADHTPDFNASSVSGCKPFQPHLTPASPIAGAIKTYDWNFGNGTTVTNPDGSPLYQKAGNYDVTLTTTDTFGCKDSRTKAKYIRVNGPTAKIFSTSNQGCKGLTATFVDSTKTDGINKITSWKWDFGDSTAAQVYTQPPFRHTYDKTGNFDVKLVVQDAAGCTDSTLDSSFVKISQLKASWDVDKLSCPGSPLYFSNYTNSQFNFTNLWNFGNGDISSSTSVNYAYPDTGTYTVTLKVRDEIGCEDSLVRTNYVYVGRPKADFTANNFSSFCTPFEAKFTNMSTYYNSSFWDLGVGTSSQQNPSIYYTATGLYNVKLRVVSPGGCYDEISKQVRVYDPNDARLAYSPLAGCRPFTTDFTAFTEMGGKFVWDFGDGTVTDTTSNKIQHIYDAPGNFVPKIILYEPSGVCIVPLTGKDNIHSFGAKIKYSLNKYLFCDTGFVRIADSTITNDPATYTWNFGDGSSSNATGSITHSYPNPGNYSILLTIHTQNGCVDSLRSRPLKVVQSPLIHITGDSVICVNDRMRLSGVFDRQDTSVVRWAWKFPNGHTAAVQYPASQQYDRAGDFLVTTVATNSSGCADSAFQPIHVNPLPKITLPATITKVTGFPVTIPGTYSSNVIGYMWSPDSTLSCADCPQPIANPKFDTKYTVVVTDSNGCKNRSEIQVITVCKNANVFVPNTFSPNGDGSNDVFYVRGRGLERVKMLRIFNRWGEVVFEKRDFAVNDASAGWDGRYKNNKPQPDVYVYQVEVFCENGSVIHFEGNVALIQ